MILVHGDEQVRLVEAGNTDDSAALQQASTQVYQQTKYMVIGYHPEYDVAM